MCHCSATPRGSQDRPIKISGSERDSPRATTPRLERLIPIEEPAPGNDQREVAGDRGRDRGEDHPMVIISGSQGVTRVRPPVSDLSSGEVYLTPGRVVAGRARILSQTSQDSQPSVPQGAGQEAQASNRGRVALCCLLPQVLPRTKRRMGSHRGRHTSYIGDSF